jgi:hypothetical protein
MQQFTKDHTDPNYKYELLYSLLAEQSYLQPVIARYLNSGRNANRKNDEGNTILHALVELGRRPHLDVYIDAAIGTILYLLQSIFLNDVDR